MRWLPALLRLIYTGLFYALLPAIAARLWWRGFKAPAYRLRWQERLGFYQCPAVTGVVWFHAVSVGEAEALFPLLKRFREQHPDSPLLVTTTTPTGSARVRAVLGDGVAHVYLPYDLPDVLRRFMRHFRPRLAVIMETEIWPNLLRACRDTGVPVVLANGRLSARSARRYRYLSPLLRDVVADFSAVCAQSPADAQRYVDIGVAAERVVMCGNVKFDVADDPALPQQAQALRAANFPGRPVWVAGSTHHGEEELLLAVHAQLCLQLPGLMLILVPRHPERFDEVAQYCAKHGVSLVRRSSGLPCANGESVYLGDTMGELKLLYAAADVAFVAGSLVPVGGHNVLEPAALGVPVLFGKHMHNFQAIADAMLAARAAQQCPDQQSLLECLTALLRHEQLRLAQAQRGKDFVNANQGAVARVLSVIGQHLPA